MKYIICHNNLLMVFCIQLLKHCKKVKEDIKFFVLNGNQPVQIISMEICILMKIYIIIKFITL